MTMKTLGLLFSLFCLAAAPFLRAQEAAFTKQGGVLEGRLLNRTDPSAAAAGVQLEVIELGIGMNIIRVDTTNAGGEFRIDGLPRNSRLMIRADYKGVNYHSMVSFDENGRAFAEIEIFEPTASMKDVEIESYQIAFQFTGEHLKSLETVSINNKTSPPQTIVNPEGSFRVSKAAGIVEPPEIRVMAPGSSMPLVQSGLESADGQSYYTVYPLRPGITRIEVQQRLPYRGRSYTYAKRFYHDVGPVDIGTIPADLQLSGEDLVKIPADSQGNFAVYRTAPFKAGSEASWAFSGGTPVAEEEPAETSGESTVTSMPGAVGRSTLVLGPLILMGFILALWYAFNRSGARGRKDESARIRRLKESREALLNSLAELYRRREIRDIEQGEFEKRREEQMRRLRAFTLLLKDS